nr:MAG TPA: hypothetical protein [Caudoviricetes sp.]
MQVHRKQAGKDLINTFFRVIYIHKENTKGGI